MPRRSNKAPGLGNALIKDRFGKKKNVSHRHVSEINAEHEDTDLNLKSVTELSSLDDFLATAKLAGTEFLAEKMNISYVDTTKQGILSEAEQKRRREAHSKFEHLLGIPRRPEWDVSMTKDELDLKERNSFLEWRRQLAEVQDNDDVVITPYEKNLDFWRQLWRVIERSEVVVQIVDARNPLLFRCKDLETYVRQVDPHKQNLLLVNKADLLSGKQRRAWKEYFDANNVNAVFWSAVLENEKLELENKKARDAQMHGGDESDDDTDDDSDVTDDGDDSTMQEENKIEEKTGEGIETDDEENSHYCYRADDDDLLLSRNQLIEFFKGLVKKEKKVMGMVGYPNVGKSSSVNTLLGIKKVAVSATPGRTKHFQTLHVDSELCLCDCPGLVFPSFISSKSDMVLCGILPIDQMRDHVGPVNLLSHNIPRTVIEGTYGINIPRPKEGEDPNRPPYSAEILNSHALSRGFMTSHGQPDNSRSARIILKDYVNGKLLYSVSPPGFDEDTYKTWTISKVEIVLNSIANSLVVSDELRPVADRINRVNKKEIKEVNHVEKEFFQPQSVKVLSKGKDKRRVLGGKAPRNKKKEKMRRVRTTEY